MLYFFRWENLILQTMQERDIDAEIASRQQQTPVKSTQQYCGTSSSADHSPSLGSAHDSASHAVTSRFNLREMKNENDGNIQNYTEADEMRRRRQKVIFTFYFKMKILMQLRLK